MQVKAERMSRLSCKSHGICVRRTEAGWTARFLAREVLRATGHVPSVALMCLITTKLASNVVHRGQTKAVKVAAKVKLRIGHVQIVAPSCMPPRTNATNVEQRNRLTPARAAEARVARAKAKTGDEE